MISFTTQKWIFFDREKRSHFYLQFNNEWSKSCHFQVMFYPFIVDICESALNQLKSAGSVHTDLNRWVRAQQQKLPSHGWIWCTMRTESPSVVTELETQIMPMQVKNEIHCPDICELWAYLQIIDFELPMSTLYLRAHVRNGLRNAYGACARSYLGAPITNKCELRPTALLILYPNKRR